MLVRANFVRGRECFSNFWEGIKIQSSGFREGHVYASTYVNFKISEMCEREGLNPLSSSPSYLSLVPLSLTCGGLRGHESSIVDIPGGHIVDIPQIYLRRALAREREGEKERERGGGRQAGAVGWGSLSRFACTDALSKTQALTR